MSSNFRIDASDLFGSRSRSRRRGPAPAPVQGSNPEFRLAFICTGNICRSAYAEHGLARLMAESPLAGVIRTSSAGVGAVVGAPLETEMGKLYFRDFGELPQHVAQAASPHFANEQDLLLVMTRDHRQRLLRINPTVLPKTFLLSEFNEIAQDLRSRGTTGAEDLPPSASPSDRLRALVRAVSQHRSSGSHAADVPDPYRRSFEVYLGVADTLRHELDRLQRTLIGVTRA